MSSLLVLLTTIPCAFSISPRGYNSWDCLNNWPNESAILAAGEFMAKELVPFGYDIVTIDGGWNSNSTSDGRPIPNCCWDANGRPYPNADLFPSASDGSGLRHVADALHGLGLKAGAWLIRGVPLGALDLPIKDSPYLVRDAVSLTRNCTWDAATLGTNAPSPAASAWYKSLALWWVEQGLDFVKIDCMWPGSPGGMFFDEDVVAFAEAFSTYAPSVTISWSPGNGMTPTNGTFLASHGGAYGVMYRVTPDFHDSNGWQPVLYHLEVAANYTDAGLIDANGTNFDLDMLPFGLQFDGQRPNPLVPCQFSQAEQVLLMTLWAVCKAPLIIGAFLPLSSDDNFTLPLLTNIAVLSVNAHSTHNAHVSVSSSPATDNTYAWTALDADGKSPIVALFNAGENAATLQIAAPAFAPAKFCATSLWSGATLPGSFSTSFSASIGAHSADLFRLTAC